MTLRLATLWLAYLLVVVACRGPKVTQKGSSPRELRHPNVVVLSPEGIIGAQVVIARVTPRAFSPRLSITATIVADPQHIARVASRTTGRVLALHVALGDVVKRGQPLIDLDTLELHQVATEYLTAIARAREANAALARQRALVAGSVGTVLDLQRVEANAAAASATLLEAEEHLHILGLTDRDIRQMRSNTSHGEARSTLRAPIEGRISAMNVTIGQVLTGTEELLVITQTNEVWASLRVYERDLGSVVTGAEVDVRVQGLPDRVFHTRVGFVSDLVDPLSRTAEARAAIVNEAGVLRPGMSAVVDVVLPSEPSALWLPTEAVQPYEGKSVVFVTVGERRFEARDVTVGVERAGFTRVLGGIAEGEQVVVHGTFALRGELERESIEER